MMTKRKFPLIQLGNKIDLSNAIVYLLTAFFCILLANWFKTLEDDVLQLMLYPHAKITETFYNINLIYTKGIGYSSSDGTFAIGGECMGSNFIIIMFGMTVCMFVKYFRGLKKALWLITSFTASIILGILVSCIRIVGSIPFIRHAQFPFFHSSIGISLYFFTLTACYALLNKLIRRISYEKNI